MSKHICILGCGRSGTSIFGEFFEHLPDYQYYSEPLLFEVSEFDYSSPVAMKVPRPGMNDETSDGLPFVVDTFLESFPEPRVIFWQVRHPLDTICSLRVGISKNWGHHPRPKDWKDWLDKPLLQQCAHHWDYLNTIGYPQIKDHVVINSFEDMIADPLQTARNICQLADIDFDKNEQPIRAWAQRVQNTNNKHFIEAKTSSAYSRPDHVKKVGRWKENLTIEEVESIKPIIAAGASLFEYVLP